MPADFAPTTIAYLCECGRKWAVPRKGLGKIPQTFKCDCGRTIIVEEGIMYSTPKPGERASARK